MTSRFAGFPPDTLQFLARLSRHNNREWFNSHKNDYHAHVVEPALAFIAAMAPGLEKLSSHFAAIPKKSGGSMMRIYRDTRFGNDKTPYKTNLGIQFRHHQGKDVHAPGYYLHVEPDELFLGVGIWHPAAPALKDIRAAIDEAPADWLAARDHAPFARRYEFVGDSLVRAPKGYAPDHPQIDDLKRKDFIALTRLTDKELTDPKLVSLCLRRFGEATPLMAFLCRALSVPF